MRKAKSNAMLRGLASTALVLLISATAWGQKMKITGTVIDNTNEPIIGASVLENGTQNGVATDLDGHFTIEVQQGAKLKISYIGYKNKEVKASNGEMFAAGSNLKNKSPEEIFYQDFKKFELNKSSFGVGQITSVNADELTEIKKELLPYMEKALGSHGESMLFFMLTDIINESTELLFYGGDSKNVVSEAFHKEPQEGEQSVILPGVVSRKKQLIPSFMTAMQQ